MHILFDAHPITDTPTGIGRYCYNLINQFQKQMPKGSKISLYQHKGQEHIFPKLNKFVFPIKNGLARSLVGFNMAIKKIKPDIIHSTTLAPFSKNIPQVISVHDICFHTHPNKYPLKTLIAFKLLFNKSIQQADAIICPSNTVKRNLHKHFDIDQNKVYVTYDAPDKLFLQPPTKNKINQSLIKHNLNKPFFLVVGDKHNRKESEIIIAAFNKSQKSQTLAQLVFVGPHKKNYSKTIIHTGFISNQELSSLYHSAQGLIFNSVCEGYGLPIVEALSANCPVICSDIPTFKELFDKRCKYYSTQKQLQNHMKLLLSNQYPKPHSNTLNHTWEKTTKDTIKIYQKLFQN